MCRLSLLRPLERPAESPPQCALPLCSVWSEGRPILGLNVLFSFAVFGQRDDLIMGLNVLFLFAVFGQKDDLSWDSIWKQQPSSGGAGAGGAGTGGDVSREGRGLGHVHSSGEARHVSLASNNSGGSGSGSAGVGPSVVITSFTMAARLESTLLRKGGGWGVMIVDESHVLKTSRKARDCSEVPGPQPSPANTQYYDSRH